MKSVVIGIDPDSSRITAVCTPSDGPYKVRRKVLPSGVPTARRMDVAWSWTYRLVKDYVDAGYEVHIFIESPFISPKFPSAAIPLSRLNGCMLAASARGGAFTIHETTIQSWKKDIVGKGNATKPQIESWCKQYWREVWKEGQEVPKTKGRQDIYDTAAINRYGVHIVKKMDHRADFFAEHPEELTIMKKTAKRLKKKD